MMPALIEDRLDEGRLVLLSRSPEETEFLGRQLAVLLQPGDVVSLDGGLGAGKTAMTRGIAVGLGSRVPVSSPTFTLLIEHPAGPGGLSLYHFDAYRLTGSEAFCAAGLDEYFYFDGVCVVEWGSLIADILPSATLKISLWPVDPSQPELRRIEIDWATRPERLRQLARPDGQTQREDVL